ncbi:GNAT family N-acetyltransferase [Peribacillus sp. SCS-26]|uniref:GNAT family N-acetyltransferase n=1 Tax=Paraperibacillus marinus TaxID=3115295 RepID=UPI003906267B
MLKGKQICLRPLEEEDAADYAELLVRNREVWQCFEPARPEDYYTVERQRKTIAEDQEAFKSGRAYNFGIFLPDGTLIGDISLYDVRTAFFQSASAGYSVDGIHTGRGAATEALSLLLHFAFETLKLRRVEAGVSPENAASIRVLEKAGFIREGLMREYLLINGRWKDHYLYAALSPQRELSG